MARASRKKRDAEIKTLIHETTGNGLSERELNSLRILVKQYTDVFHTASSAGPPAKVKPLKGDIAADAKPT